MPHLAAAQLIPGDAILTDGRRPARVTDLKAMPAPTPTPATDWLLIDVIDTSGPSTLSLRGAWVVAYVRLAPRDEEQERAETLRRPRRAAQVLYLSDLPTGAEADLSTYATVLADMPGPTAVHGVAERYRLLARLRTEVDREAGQTEHEDRIRWAVEVADALLGPLNRPS